jgi:hypothetical protein
MAETTRNFLYDDVLPRVERIGWAVAVIGLLMKYFLFSKGEDQLLMVGLSTVAIVYFLRAFAPETEESGPDIYSVYVPISEQVTLLRKFQYIASALTLLGILLKFLFWEGQAELLSVGVIILLVTISLKWASGQLTRSFLLIAALGLVTWVVPTDTLARQFYRDDPALVEKMIFHHYHPGDKAATNEMWRLLNARRNR